MATEPQRPIEKLLGDYARKRGAQAGAPPELHPADRRALQDEVRRHYAGGQRRARSGWFSGRWAWPRFAWTAGIGLLMLLSAAVWQINFNKPRQERFAAMSSAEPTRSLSWADQSAKKRATVTPATLADDKAKGRAPAENAPSLAEVYSAASAKAPATLTNVLDSYAAARPSIAQPVVTAPVSTLAPLPASIPASAPTPVTSKTLAYADQSSRVYERQQSAPVGGLAAAAPAAVNELLAFSNSADFRSSSDSSQAVSQLGIAVAPSSATEADAANRAQANQANQAAAPTGPVLAAFRFEQAGSQIRVIDRDGSIYAGYLESADNTARRKALRLQVPTLARTADSLGKRTPSTTSNLDEEMQSGVFWVAGTNRSLNQAVFFRGYFLPWTNAPLSGTSTANAAAAFSPATTQNTGQQAGALPLLNLRISGTAQIGDSGAVKIEANPAAP